MDAVESRHPDRSPSGRPGRRSFLIGASASLLVACTGTETIPAVSADSSAAAASTSGDAAAPTTPTTSPTVPATPPSEPTTDADSASAPTESASEAAPTPTESDPIQPSGPVELTAAMFDALAVCTLIPQSTEGPYPSREKLDRREIHEGYPGHPLRLGMRVVDSQCQPVPGAVVDVWHTDATGDYSEYEDNGSGKDEGDGSTFCRGVQTANADGIVEFQTIYPGWYEGRAVHIHVQVRVDGTAVRTAQVYLDESYTEMVYAEGEYAQFGSPDTPWSDDRIVGDPTTDGTGLALVAAETSLGPGTLGLVNLGI